MNRKILFSEGGQPVFLDDLSLMQDEIRDSVDNLIHALGADLNQEIVFVKKPDVTYNGTRTSFSNGVVWHKEHGLLYMPPVTDIDLGQSGKAYVQITVAKTGNRDFEDGQVRPCLKEVTAKIVSTDTGDGYLFSSIKSMVTELATMIDKADKSEYETVEVEWQNGYSGVVEVKQIYGGVRYHVKASSSSYDWNGHEGVVCFGNFHPSASPMFLTGGEDSDTDSPHFLILQSNGMMGIHKYNDDSLQSPDLCSIDVTFDVLGQPW